MNPHELPVYAQKHRVLEALEENQVIVVESPTGSGKTTQLPLILHEAGYGLNGVIGVTQPRRIAAVSVSEYIAGQVGSSIPGLVGYKMRFEDHTDRSTRIKVMTDGILLQEIKADYRLSQYSVIMVDEAHERSLNIDFILGLLKRVLEERPEFKVIISSATINPDIFSEYFWSCPVIRIDARMYPVELIYAPPPTDSYEDLIYKITQIVAHEIESDEAAGDILIFLSGERAIKDCVNALYALPIRRKLFILPLYGRLSKEEQDQVFPPPPEGKIKVVVATNIAETSITIDGITVVIDSGLAKMNYYNPRTYISSLVEGEISKASANQRRGRAGRTRPGRSYRLYTKESFDQRPLYTLEEIYRTDLSEVVLRMAELGITEFESFDFISPPGRRGIAGAIETLELLEALTPERSLSPIGEMMAIFPLLPRHSRMIVEAIHRYPEIIEEVLIGTAFLTTNTPFLLPQGEEIPARRAHHRYRDDLGDFVSYLKLFQAYTDAPDKTKFCETRYLDERIMAEIANVKQQLEEMVGEMGIPIGRGGSHVDYLCAVATGLIQFVCVRLGSEYRSLTAERVQIHPGSVMFRETPNYIVAGEIVRTSKMYARSVSPLEREWLLQISPRLAQDLSALQKPTRAGAKKQRDTTWQITLGDAVFRLTTFKGKNKKIAILPWEKLKPLLRQKDLGLDSSKARLRGKVVYREYELLVGETLSTIMRVAPYFDPEYDITANDLRGRNFFPASEDERVALCEVLDHTLKLTQLKKSSRTLGFLALCTDNRGRYWYKPKRGLFSAATDSLSSVESLVDEVSEELEPDCLDRLNAIYRRLVEIMEL